VREGKKVKKTAIGAFLAAVIALSLAQVAAAQDPPPPPGSGGFGHRGPGELGGPGGPEGFMGGRRGCVATTSAPCPEYQFTFTITTTEPVLLGNTTSTVTTTTTGTIAGEANGSTYREVQLSGMGPWASGGKSAEFIDIKNLDPSVMMAYLVNVTKGTYEQFAIHPLNADGKWQGKGPRDGPHDGGGKGWTRPKPTTITNYKISDSSYTCPTAEQTTMSHTIQLPGVTGTTTVTSNSVYCLALKLMVEQDHSDPRFGTRTYQLSGYLASPHVSVAPPFGLTPAPTLVQRKDHGRDHGPRGEGGRPPVTP
jgi:hypothetical protein